MSTVRDTARLHHKTVSNHKSHVLVKTRSRGPDKNSRVTHVKVDRRVWDAAVELCEGDAGRLVIMSETCVIVRNNS